MTTFKEQLPGLTIHINEGRLLGTFELPPADMQHIRYHGRQVIVIVADAERVAVADTKDGDTKASWTFKAVDAAIVRDQSMVDHLANVLYLDGLEELDPVPVTVVVPGGPAPFASTPNVSEALAGVDLSTGEVIPGSTGQEDESLPSRREDLEDVIQDSTKVDDEEDELELSTELIGEVPEHNLFRPPVSTRPIQNKDKMLERFLNDERVGSGLK